MENELFSVTIVGDLGVMTPSKRKEMANNLLEGTFLQKFVKGRTNKMKLALRFTESRTPRPRSK